MRRILLSIANKTVLATIGSDATEEVQKILGIFYRSMRFKLAEFPSQILNLVVGLPSFVTFRLIVCGIVSSMLASS